MVGAIPIPVKGTVLVTRVYQIYVCGDNLNTTQTLECSKGKYNVKIINESLSEGLTNNLCRPKARNKKEAKGING
jgi:hypothetical protein